jgi:hypothetical protein
MNAEYSTVARRIGIVSAIIVAVLIFLYAVTLTAGFVSLDSNDEQIGDPYFTLLEVLIIVMMPPMVSLMVAVHAWAPARLKALSLTSVIFMGLVAAVTCALHFVILTLNRQAEFSALESLPLFVSFKWPSLAYALDILAWDVFFAISMLFASIVFSGSRLAVSIRVSMVLSGVLALAGLSGVVTGDMGLRNIGVVGYVGVFFIVVLLLGVLFHRSAPIESEGKSAV